MTWLFRDVEEREQEDPDDVDEVPVEADQFHALQLAVAARVVRDPDHEARARDHVRGMDARSGVVEAPERVRGVRVAVADLDRPLDALDAEEARTILAKLITKK